MSLEKKVGMHTLEYKKAVVYSVAVTMAVTILLISLF